MNEQEKAVISDIIFDLRLMLPKNTLAANDIANLVTQIDRLYLLKKGAYHDSI
jgi:hypothetical protein